MDFAKKFNESNGIDLNLIIGAALFVIGTFFVWLSFYGMRISSSPMTAKE